MRGLWLPFGPVLTFFPVGENMSSRAALVRVGVEEAGSLMFLVQKHVTQQREGATREGSKGRVHARHSSPTTSKP